MEIFEAFLFILLVPLGIAYELVEKHGWKRLLFLIPLLFAVPVLIYILFLIKL